MLLDGKKYTPQTREEVLIIRDYNKFCICREFGRTEKELLETSSEFFGVCTSLLSMIYQKQALTK